MFTTLQTFSQMVETLIRKPRQRNENRQACQALLKFRAEIEQKILLALPGASDDAHRTELYRFQTGIIALSDRLWNLSMTHIPGQTGDSVQAGSALATEAIKVLDEVLAFLSTYCIQGLDLQQKLPENQKHAFLEQMPRLTEQARAHLQSLELEAPLISICLQPFEHYTREYPAGMISFQEQQYAMQTLGRVCSLRPGKEQPASAMLTGLLFSCNFNSDDFLRYYTASIEARLKQADGWQDQVDLLTLLIKENHQRVLVRGMALRPGYPDVKQRLHAWLEMEFDCMELQRRQAGIYKNTTQQDYKISTSLSVCQIALMLRLMVDSKLIIEKNRSGLIRFIAAIINSRHNEHISADNLRNHYYQADLSTARAVRERLLEMVSLSHKLP